MGAETPLAQRAPLTRWQKLQPPALVVLLLLLAWELADRFAKYPVGTFAGPWETARSLWYLVETDQLLTALKATLRRLGVSFLLSLLIGAFMAAMMVLMAPVRRGVQPLLLGLQSLPGLAWIPVSILWFGYTETTLYFVTVIGSVFAVTMGFVDAFATVPPIYTRAARNMGLRGPALLLRVTVPAATPLLVSAAKVGWSFAWRSLVGAEIFFASLGGVGYLLNSGREFNDPAQIFASMVIVLVLGIVFDRLLFSNLERAVRRRWGLAER